MDMFERNGLTMKVTKWLARSQCNGSAVVSPLPQDRSNPFCNLSKRTSEKILELLGPENRDQQRQIRDLLKKSSQTEDSDSDSTSDDESTEMTPSITPRSYPLPRAEAAAGFSGFPVQCRGGIQLSSYASKAPPPSSQYVRGNLSPMRFERTENRQHVVQRTDHLRPVSPVRPHFPNGQHYYLYQSPRPSPRPSPRRTPVGSPPHPSGGGFPLHEELPRRSLVYLELYPSPRHSHSNSPRQCRSPSPMGGFVLGEKLGSGSYGTVYKSKDFRTGKEVALKVLHDDEALCPQEVAVLCRLNHSNIVKYLGSTTLADGRSCIILELMSCSLLSLLKDQKGLDEGRIRSYTRQVLLGLEYLHAQQIVHRDVKCANILLDGRGTAKLSDFGVSKKIASSMAKSCKGTISHMAPEVLLSGSFGKYGLPADIWSLGCIVVEMASSKPPWNGCSMMEIMMKIKGGGAPPIPQHLSPDAASFVKKCFRRDPKQRPTASMLLRHSFLNYT